MKNGFIYCLIDPTDNRVRYIGQTVRSLNERLRKHKCDSKKVSCHVQCWIKGLLDKELSPIIQEIEKCSLDILDEREQFYIQQYRSMFPDLTNIANGGQVVRHIADETRLKISLSLRGKKQSEATKAKRRESSLKTWSSPELRALKKEQTTELNKLGVIGTKGKLSHKKGKPFSGDKEKLSASLREHFSNKEVRDKSALSRGAKPFLVYSVKSILRANRYRSHPIIEKGELLFEDVNIRDVARRLNLINNNIRHCLQGKRNVVGNYIFEYK